jgi:CRP-like cAMP-binding protein
MNRVMSFTQVLQPEDLKPVIDKLSHLAPIHRLHANVLVANQRDGRAAPPRAQLLGERQAIVGVRVLLSGWACHKRLLSDGRCQIMHLLLPGDFIGAPSRRGTLSCSSVVALTPVRIGTIGEVSDPAVEAAFQMSDALTEAYLMNHVVRLGRQSAYERLAHLILEIRDRLALAGLTTNPAFEFPLTQDVLADVLGATNVHVNRTLQQMRRQGVIELNGRMLRILDAEALTEASEYHAPMVTSWQDDS